MVGHEGKIAMRSGTNYYELAYENAVKGYYIDGKIGHCEPETVVVIKTDGKVLFGKSVDDPYLEILPLSGHETLLTPAPE